MGPEAGAWDGESVADWQTHPPKVYVLCYEFDYWSGDVLLGFPECLIATADLKAAMQSAGLTGVRFDRVEVRKSEQFDEIEPEVTLPAFVWVKVEGKAGEDDFGITRYLRLVVSERALKLLKRLGTPNAKVSAFEE